MKRIGILTAGGDTPALNATLHGAVERANQLGVEVIGLMGGFDAMYDPVVPHVRLNPLFTRIPELDWTRGGTILGASRRYIDPDEPQTLDEVCDRLRRLGLDGLVCIGGDGTLNGMQPLAERIPTVLAPKTIDNDLGLNFLGESDKWNRVADPAEKDGYRYLRTDRPLVREQVEFAPERMINYATPGYATAVFVSASGVGRIRTTAESHRRIAIIEVMGRHSGYIALGTAYGQPDLILVPEYPVEIDRLVERVKEIYDVQHNVVIVCGEGVVDETGHELGAQRASTDPAGNVILSGAADHLRRELIERIGDKFFQHQNRQDSASAAIFTRKVGHTQRGGRPLAFDRFHAAQLGGHAVDLLYDRQQNRVAVLQWTADRGFFYDSYPCNAFRDRWGVIHARTVHPSFYDPVRMQPSTAGIEYLLPIFTNAIGPDDVEYIHQTVFDSGNLYHSYHSSNVDVAKRIEFLRPSE